MSDDLTPGPVSAPLLTDADREALVETILDPITDHPMWIGDDGEPLDYLPERERRIGDYLNQVEAHLLPAVERIVREHAQQAWEQGVDAAFIAISSPPYMGRGGITNPYDLPEEG